MCLPAQAIGLAGRGAWSRGKVTRRGRGLTRPMEKPIHRWKRPSLMEEPLTNRRDADIDKRGAVKRRRVHIKPICPQRVQNGETSETSKNHTTKRKRLDSPLRLPGSGSLQTQTSSSRRSTSSVSFASVHLGPPPPLGSSLVFVYDGGVIPHRWLISILPTTAVTPHINKRHAVGRPR